jgi:hypothetical protein
MVTYFSFLKAMLPYPPFLFCYFISEISLRESERPVPSYPLMVLDRNTQWGPKNDFTYGIGIAAA